MKKIMYVICFAGIVVQSCNQHQPVTDNPFLIPFDTPFEVPPFDKIQNRHYLPAFREGIKEQEAEIQAILKNVTTTYGGTFDLDVVPFSPVCVNDDGVTDRVVHILQDHCSHRVDLVPLKRGSGSEDFAYFSAAVPSSFYYVGSDAPVIGHSPEFHWDSNALKYMCETMLTIVYYFESYA